VEISTTDVAVTVALPVKKEKKSSKTADKKETKKRRETGADVQNVSGRVT